MCMVDCGCFVYLHISLYHSRKYLWWWHIVDYPMQLHTTDNSNIVNIFSFPMRILKCSCELQINKFSFKFHDSTPMKRKGNRKKIPNNQLINNIIESKRICFHKLKHMTNDAQFSSLPFHWHWAKTEMNEDWGWYHITYVIY